MRLPSTIFRQYDIRGPVDQELTPAAAHAVGQAYTTFAMQRLGKPPRVAAGRDNRPSGAKLAQGGAARSAAAGGSALGGGEPATPALPFATTPLARRFKVVVDCGNGVTSLVAVETLRELGVEVVALFAESDGTFPHHHPDPTVLENLHDLQVAVKKEKAELGIAFDGDGDRIGAVDETGEPVLGDQLLVLFGRDLVRRLGKGKPVIFAVKCSAILPQMLTRAGLKPVMW